MTGSRASKAYVAVGMAIGALAPVGLSVAHAIDASARPSWAWFVADVHRVPVTYGYMLAWGVLVLGALGYVVGRRAARLEQLADTDPLTGLFNRRYLEGRSLEALARARRGGTRLSMLVVDVDGLKTINDTFGHAEGDAVIRTVAESIAASVRSGDVAARVGGDEFAILLPRAGVSDALAAGGRIADEVARRTANVRAPLSVSVGVAELDGGPTRSLAQLLEAADRALYDAKGAGRGCVFGVHGSRDGGGARGDEAARSSRVMAKVVPLARARRAQA
ncbi:MAG: GGDEF domain-containing protein [Myxococcales bacterium]|nr:GGDEF domain-containing protein [Myxococcales bacterium]